MANRGEVPANHPVQHVLPWHANNNVPGHRGRHHHQYGHLHLLDAARALMLLGAVAAVSAVGNAADADDGDAEIMVLLGFVTWLLGVGLLSLVPVAGRFPRADALAGAASAALLGYLFTQWN